MTPIEFAKHNLVSKAEHHASTVASSLRSVRGTLAREDLCSSPAAIGNMQTHLANAMEAAVAKAACEYALTLIDMVQEQAP